MSASNIQPASSSTSDWHLDLRNLDLPKNAASGLAVVDSGIDDPVNDTGLGPLRSDLQLSDEFACLLSVICQGSGEFS